MPDRSEALRKRITPSVPITLELEDDGGAKFTKSFHVSFDYNTVTTIEERTGLQMVSGKEHESVWKNPTARVTSIMFWAAILNHHPEYASDEGLKIIRSYMDASNATKIAKAMNDAFVLTLSKEQQEHIRSEEKKEEEKAEARKKAQEEGKPDPTPPAEKVMIAR